MEEKMGTLLGRGHLLFGTLPSESQADVRKGIHRYTVSINCENGEDFPLIRNSMTDTFATWKT
jgi:hypothetical protein